MVSVLLRHCCVSRGNDQVIRFQDNGEILLFYIGVSCSVLSRNVTQQATNTVDSNQREGRPKHQSVQFGGKSSLFCIGVRLTARRKFSVDIVPRTFDSGLFRSPSLDFRASGDRLSLFTNDVNYDRGQ